MRSSHCSAEGYKVGLIALRYRAMSQLAAMVVPNTTRRVGLQNQLVSPSARA